MKKLLLVLVVVVGLFGADQSEEKKIRLERAVEMLGGSCGKVSSFSEFPGKIHIYCTNGRNYVLKFDGIQYSLKAR